MCCGLIPKASNLGIQPMNRWLFTNNDLGMWGFSDWAWDSFLTMTHCGRRFLRPNVKKVLLYYMDLLVKSEDLNQAVLHRSTYGIWLVVPSTGRCQDMPSVNCQLVNVRITTQKYDETCAPLVRLPFAKQNTKKRTAAAAARRVRGNGRVRETNRRGKWAFRRGSVLSE